MTATTNPFTLLPSYILILGKKIDNGSAVKANGSELRTRAHACC